MIDWLSVLGNRLLGVIRSLRDDDRIIVIGLDWIQSEMEY